MPLPDYYVKILQYSLYDDLNQIPEHQNRESIESKIVEYWLAGDPTEGIYGTDLSGDTIDLALKLTDVMSGLTHHWPVVYPLPGSNKILLDYRFRDSERSHLVLVAHSNGKLTASFADSDVTGVNSGAAHFDDIEQVRESVWLKNILDPKQDLICQQHLNYEFKSYSNSIFYLIDQVNILNKKFSPEIYMDHDNSVNFDLRIPGTGSGDHFESEIYLDDGNLIHDGMITRDSNGYPEILAIYDYISNEEFIDLVVNGYES